MRKIKIAQIGMNTLSHCGQIFQSLCKQSDIFEMAGICLPENESERLPHRMAELRSVPQLTLDQVLNDPSIEAVAVETEEIFCTKYALLAARNGKHVHMEKPGGRELADFERLVAAVKESGKVFHTGYMYRYNPAVQELLKKVRAGELGRIISVEAQMNCLHNAKNRQWLQDFPGGMMFFLGCHLVDLIVQIQGMPENVIALNRSSGLDGVTADDFGMAVLEYKNGVSFAKTTAVERGGYLRRQLVVTGEKGTVEIRPLERGTESEMYTDQTVCTAEAWGEQGEDRTFGSFDRYDNMLASFATMVRGEKENPWSHEYELELYKVVLRCCGAL